jgi:hypothetical protein
MEVQNKRINLKTFVLQNMTKRFKAKATATKATKAKAKANANAKAKVNAKTDELKGLATRQILPTANSYAKQGDDNDPQIVLLITLHALDHTTPLLIPENLKLRSMNSIVRGLSSYNGGRCGVEIDEMESALSLRIANRPIQFVKDNLTEFGKNNAKLLKYGFDNIKQNSSDEGDYSVLNESDLYDFSIPVKNRNYYGEKKEARESIPMGVRILHWKNNPPIDSILDRFITPNALNPSVSSFHIYDNLYSRISNIQNSTRKTYKKIVIDEKISETTNLINNEISINEYKAFLNETSQKLNILFKDSTSKLSRVKNSYKYNTKIEPPRLVFTLQDIINDFYGLGYRSIVIVDSGCRDIITNEDSSSETLEESARIQEQSKLNFKTSAFVNDAFGTKRHKKGKRKRDRTKKAP